MADPYVGEIRLVSFLRLPYYWCYCDGRLLPIREFQALFGVIGTRYGGNGSTNFAVPDLRGRVPIHWNHQRGSPFAFPGNYGGQETQTLGTPNLPAHNHSATVTPRGPGGPPQISASVDVAATSVNNLSDPTGNILAVPKPSGAGSINAYQPVSAKTGLLGGVNASLQGGGFSAGTVQLAPTGQSEPFSIMPPNLTLNFIIATEGIFPTTD